MPEYVRVKQKGTGHELSVLRSMYDFAPDAYALVDKPAVDAGGEPLRAKFHTSVAKKAAEKQAGSGQKARSEEDN